MQSVQCTDTKQRNKDERNATQESRTAATVKPMRRQKYLIYILIKANSRTLIYFKMLNIAYQIANNK